MKTLTIDQEKQVAEALSLLGQADLPRGAALIEPLAHLFARVGKVLQGHGRAVVLLDGRAEAVDPHAKPEQLVRIVGEDPARFCAFRVNPCTGAYERYASDPANPIKDGEKFVISLCNPPQDGLADRASAVSEDRYALEASGARTEVVQLQDGREALLVHVPAARGVPSVTMGTVLPAEYPVAGSDWILLGADVALDGFAGQRKNAVTETGLLLVEHSIHPQGGPSRAAPFILAAYLTRGTKLRKVPK